MQTPSHLVIAAAVAKAIPAVPMNSAFIIGSVAPDLALYALSLIGGLYYTQVKKISAREAADLMFGQLFFKNKAWIAVHNSLHSPLLLVLLIIPLAFVMSSSAVAAWFFWFLLSFLLHTAVDIPTHHNDGPLLFFPFNWTIRFQSPISYWDARRGARSFMAFEISVVILLLYYLFSTPILNLFR